MDPQTSAPRTWNAQTWNERYDAAGLVWSQAPNQFVAAQVASLHPGAAVDLGAGEGRNAIHLARLGWEVTAVDFSAAGLDKGRRIAGDLPIRWLCADATTWRPPAPVDLVLAAYLQLVAAERRLTVRTAFESLRPGGTLLWVAHDSSNLAEGTGGPQDPAVLTTADDVLGDLDDVGLAGASYTVVSAGRVARTVPDDGHGRAAEGGSGRTAWDCLVRLVRTA